MLGIDPGPRSLRELLWMAEAKRIYDWSHTASIASAVIIVSQLKKQHKESLLKKVNPTAGLAKKKHVASRLSKQQKIQQLNQMVGLEDAKRRSPKSR